MCSNEDNLIRLISGQMPESQAHALREHLLLCPECRRQHAELAEMWNVLGEAELHAPPRDLAPAIVSRARWGNWGRRWMALAASVLLAAGIGIVAALATPSRSSTLAGTVTEADVAQAIGLDVLAGDSPLADLIESDEEEPS